jgi:DNA ligase-1
MRFPRINRIRWDKPPGEADRIEALTAQLPKAPPKGGALGLAMVEMEADATTRDRDRSSP